MSDRPASAIVARPLALAADRLRKRWRFRPSWGEPVGIALRRLATSPSPARFDRREPEPSRPLMPTRVAARTEGPDPAEETASPLPHDIDVRLRELIGPAAGSVRVREDDETDVQARELRADAVTVGTQVGFRRGKLRPRDPAEFALLAHEASHVRSALAPNASWRRSTALGMALEEAEALDLERRVLSARAARDASTQPAHRSIATPSAPAATTSGSRPQHPPAVALAAEDRATVAPNMLDAATLARLRQSLYGELIHQIRIDLERGG